MPLLAQALGAQPDSTLSYLVVGIVVVGLSSLVQLALAGKQLFGGNKGERQIEPTQLAGITAELKTQTATLAKLDREMGEAKAGIKAVDEKITSQGVQVENAFRRINAISTESSQVRARLDDHLADHRASKA
jgi:hypothetical protein